MLKYLLKRLGVSLIVIIGVTMIIFSIIRLQPGNPYLSMVKYDTDPNFLEEKLTELGYYDPVPVQYFKWIGRVAKGDLGYSIHYRTPVVQLIKERFGNTLLLAITSFILSTALAIFIGVFSASRSKTILDYIITVISFIGVSIPVFFFGLLLIKVFGYDLNLIPISGMETLGTNYEGIKRVLDIGKHMIMPVIVLSITQTASLLRYTRSSMIEVLNEDYMRTARSKGLSRQKTIWKHGFRNSLISIITVLCMRFPDLLSGALIAETVFVWPGMGSLNYQAILNQDYPLIMGITFIMAIIIILCNLLADILYAVADPRIRICD